MDKQYNMKYIVATSDTPYFRWQILVQINNFKRLGILDDLTYVISIKSRKSKYLNLIQKSTGVRIETYKDERKQSGYSSSIRPHILAKHFAKYPEEAEIYYYLDPDVLFREKPKYKDIVYKYKPVWFISDTKSYLDSKYIKGKGEELFELMCNTVNIDPKLVTQMDKSAGGAQYIIKNAGSDFWKNVEVDSEELYSLMIKTSRVYSPEHPIQAWTADMWAVLWNAWKNNMNTIIDETMNFSWATDQIDRHEESNIFHNAGVFDQTDLFNKVKFTRKHPFNEDFSYVSKDRCSIKYVEEILDTKNNYLELIKKL